MRNQSNLIFLISLSKTMPYTPFAVFVTRVCRQASIIFLFFVSYFLMKEYLTKVYKNLIIFDDVYESIARIIDARIIYIEGVREGWRRR